MYTTYIVTLGGQVLRQPAAEVIQCSNSCKSNKGTGGMESSVVLFKPRIHLFACTHPSVSSTLDCNDLLVYKHQSTALCSNTFGLWFLVVYKHQSPALCFKHVWIVDPCLRTRISLQPCVSNTFGSWFRVGVQASVSGPFVSNTFGMWFLVCVPSRPHQNENT